ncbi:DUF3455 domain-containing protein [Streptomyces sp. NPDC002701]|uniref:DUF3455 domain-containing protein n=1 Tax=unclassified Streptomyces TaxID=2593676 RepID=UPI0036C434F6
MKLATRLALTTTALATAAVGTLSGVAVAQAPAAQPARAAAAVPPALTVPDGNRLTATLSAVGAQIYTCTDGAWTFLEPAATLWAKNDPSRIPVAIHLRGPIWVSTADGSSVSASAVASSPKNGAIPELLLKATATSGTGVFAGVSYVQRLDTTGGVAPTTACTTGQRASVPYSATYTFYKPAK